ncbi:39S ribosomal protein L51, mitochondrial [Vidua macroura]|nr:39S ribosomal protein L51, mitochondrial [Vidua chalybeata]XP_053825171.1 39S ribosomal protein L51, mitochondrial [Vidua macroura]
MAATAPHGPGRSKQRARTALAPPLPATGLSAPGGCAARRPLAQSPAPLPSRPLAQRHPRASALRGGRGGPAAPPLFPSRPFPGAPGIIPMAAAATLLLQAAGRALLGRAASLPCAQRGFSDCGGARWAPARPGLPVPLSSPLAGLSRPIRIKEPPKRKPVDRWTKKRALFGVYDNVGILGGFQIHPKNLIMGPTWLRGWRGNELQRCIRKKQMVGDRMFAEDYHKLSKRIRYLYKRFNRTGKHR